MQVFVRKSDLATSPVLVIASYPDAPTLAMTLHGDGTTLLSLPPNKIDSSKPPPVLFADFRATCMEQMCNDQAARRIIDAFPTYMQTNATSDFTRSVTLYGADPTAWPSDAQARKTEADRGWAYIADVRRACDGLETNITLIDPTDDSNWPTVITPIYIPPV
jgi:hypothetical protein